MRFCPACGARLPEPPPVTCEECGVRHWRNAKPCAGALVTNVAGRLLLVQRDHDPWHGRWDIPGGFCEVDELPAATAVREVQEETGLDVEITGLLGMWLDGYPDPADERGQVTLNCYFDAVVVGGEERPQPGEVARLGWFERDALPADDEIAFPEHALEVLKTWQDRHSSGLRPGPGRPAGGRTSRQA